MSGGLVAAFGDDRVILLAFLDILGNDPHGFDICGDFYGYLRIGGLEMVDVVEL